MECFEMESRSSPSSFLNRSHPPLASSSSRRNRLQKKVLGEELELRDLPQGQAISCWWMTLPTLYYLMVIAGGVIASISVGDVTAAFADNCVFYANLTLKGLDGLVNNSKILSRENVEVNQWGDMDNCLFPEYTSVACVMYAGVLLVMVLQCGRGGGKSALRGRGIAESWRIVPIAFVFNLIFLILSSIIFGNVQNGFAAFCDGMSQSGSSKSLGNVSSCAEVLKYTFPWDKYNTNLYKEYVLAKLGATLQLIGSLLAFLTIIIRCCLPADFVVYRRRQIMMAPGIQQSYQDEEQQQQQASTSSGHLHYYDPNLSKLATTTTAMSRSAPELADGDDDKFLPMPEATATTSNSAAFSSSSPAGDGDNDSIHSARSDAHLVPSSEQSKTNNWSRTSSTSKIKITSSKDAK